MRMTSSDSFWGVTDIFLGGIMSFICRMWDYDNIDMPLSTISLPATKRRVFSQFIVALFLTGMSGIYFLAMETGFKPSNQDFFLKAVPWANKQMVAIHFSSLTMLLSNTHLLCFFSYSLLGTWPFCDWLF